MVAHAFNPSTREAEAGRFLSSRPAWSTEWVLQQPRLNRETLSQTNKQTNPTPTPTPPKKEAERGAREGNTCPEGTVRSGKPRTLWRQSLVPFCAPVFPKCKMGITNTEREQTGCAVSASRTIWAVDATRTTAPSSLFLWDQKEVSVWWRVSLVLGQSPLSRWRTAYVCYNWTVYP